MSISIYIYIYISIYIYSHTLKRERSKIPRKLVGFFWFVFCLILFCFESSRSSEEERDVTASALDNHSCRAPPPVKWGSSCGGTYCVSWTHFGPHYTCCCHHECPWHGGSLSSLELSTVALFRECVAGVPVCRCFSRSLHLSSKPRSHRICGALLPSLYILMV